MQLQLLPWLQSDRKNSRLGTKSTRRTSPEIQWNHGSVKHMKSIPFCSLHMIPNSVYIFFAFYSYKGCHTVVNFKAIRMKSRLGTKSGVLSLSHLSALDQGRSFWHVDQILRSGHDQYPKTGAALNSGSIALEFSCNYIRSVLASLSFNVQVETMYSEKWPKSPF